MTRGKRHRLRRARALEARLASLVEQAPDGIFVADLSGCYTEVNAAGCRMLGYTREELVGKTIVDLIPGDRLAQLEREKAQLLRGEPLVSEWVLRRKDGGWLPVEVSANILPDGRWQGFVRDISERKRQEELAARAREQLRESEERFRLTFDEAPIGMALVALDGSFFRVNRALCEIVGYRAEELVGLKFQQITHPEDLDADLEQARRLHSGEIPRYQLAKRYVRKDGTLVDVMLSGSLLRDARGEPLYFIAEIEDISEQRQREREQRFLAELGPALASTLEYEETLSRVAAVAVRELADVAVLDVVQDDGETRRMAAHARDPAKAWVADALRRTPQRRRPPVVQAVYDTRRPVLVEVTPELLAATAQDEEHARARCTASRPGPSWPCRSWRATASSASSG